MQKDVFYSAIKPIRKDEIKEVIDTVAQSYYRNNKNEKSFCDMV